MSQDVIVVGSRIAGAATAMLLARAGLKVLVLDRDTFPSDTLSTHQVQVPGCARLAKWGLLDKVVAAGTPATRDVRFHMGQTRYRGPVPDRWRCRRDVQPAPHRPRRDPGRCRPRRGGRGPREQHRRGADRAGRAHRRGTRAPQGRWSSRRDRHPGRSVRTAGTPLSPRQRARRRGAPSPLVRSPAMPTGTGCHCRRARSTRGPPGSRRVAHQRRTGDHLLRVAGERVRPVPRRSRAQPAGDPGRCRRPRAAGPGGPPRLAGAATTDLPNTMRPSYGTAGRLPVTRVW